jgi:hypothetical protein
MARSWIALVLASVSLAGADSRAEFPVKEGALYVADCRQAGAAFTCSQFLMDFDPTQPTGVRTRALKPVRQPLQSPAPNYKAAVIDTRRNLAYLHAGCTGTYVVTDLRTDSARIFPTPGIRCLQSLVLDETSGRVLAVGGEVEGDNSSVDSLLRLSRDGEVELLADLSAQVDRRLRHLHPFKELVSFDERERTLMSPLFFEGDDARSMLRVKVDAGKAEVLPWIPGVQHQFYDPASASTLAYDCRVPDIVRVDSLPGLAFSSLFQLDFGPVSQATRCTDGFTGAGYDPEGRLQFILFRKNDVFFIAVSDVGNRRYLGLFPTDATSGTFGFGHIAPTTFFSAGFVPGS